MWGFMTARIIIFSICLISSLAQALEYRTYVQVPAMFDVQEAIDDAIAVAAERLTGIPVIQLMTNAPDLFSLSEALINSYGYEGDSFVADIDVDGLKVRLRAAGIELWEATRPEFLVWVTEERGLERLMVGQEPSLIVNRLILASERFDVPVRRPLMDLEDTMALSPAEIWGEFSGAVTSASARYDVKNILVVGDRPERQSLKYWFFDVDGDFQSGEIEGENPDDRVNTLITVFINYARDISNENLVIVDRQLITGLETLGAKRQVISGEWPVRVEYTEIIRLMELIDYFEALESISISKIRVQDNVATLVL